MYGVKDVCAGDDVMVFVLHVHSMFTSSRAEICVHKRPKVSIGKESGICFLKRLKLSLGQESSLERGSLVFKGNNKLSFIC